MGINAQETYTLKGTITNASSNETLIGVNVIIPEEQKGVVTNEYGFYSIKLQEGTYTLEISYLGFQTIRETITIAEDTTFNTEMTEGSENLDEEISSV